jgi:uncharacterized protein (TIGR04255 family)
VYPNAPVVLVAIEARHPDAGSLGPGEQAELKRLLSDVFPLPQPVTAKTFTTAIGIQIPNEVREEVLPRFAKRDQTTAVTFSSQSVVIETTAHETFDQLSDLFLVAIEARQAVAPVDGLVRLGLRYVDEIRVPDVRDQAEGWAEWVDRTLLGPVAKGIPFGLEPEQWQGAVIFDSGEGRKLGLRYGPRVGYAIAPGGPLQRPTPSPGPFFLIDMDSFWTPTGEVPEFSAQVIARKCDDLHEPVHGLFESLITERLRIEVLRRA